MNNYHPLHVSMVVVLNHHYHHLLQVLNVLSILSVKDYEVEFERTAVVVVGGKSGGG